MKKIISFMVMVLFVVSLPVWAEMRGGVGDIYLPNESGQESVVPLLIDNFPTGTTNFSPSMYPTLYEVKNKLMTDNMSYGVIQGTVSNLHINNGCYVDPSNPAYFSLSTGPQHIMERNAAETDRRCNAALATSRAWTVRNWLVQQGVPSNRLIIYDFPVESKQADNNLRNQSVAVLIVHSNSTSTGCPGTNCPAPKLEINVPTGCKYTTDQNVVNGTLVIKVNMTCSPATVPTTQDTTKTPEKCSKWKWHCLSKGEKGVVIGGAAIGVGAIILSQTCIRIGGGKGGGNGNDGGGIAIGGKCGGN